MAHVYTGGVEIVPGFKLIKMLGRGGFGEVWKATAPGGAEAAIKIISLGERYGFKEYRSIQLVKQVRHPNLVPITAFWLRNEAGEFFEQIMGDNTIARQAQELELIIAMGLCEKSLLDRLRECQRAGQNGIPVEELLGYMEDAAKAIDYLNQPIHDLGEDIGGIQHCDIKPQNILIVGGAAQVCDFGLARVLGDSRATSAKGTAAYMAPEVILDSKPSRSTDQYCFAISYVELRTGTLPLNVSSPHAAIMAHVHGKLDLSKLPAVEQPIIKRATSVDPEKRYPTTIEMVRALRQAIEGYRPKSTPLTINLDELAAGKEVVPGYKLLKPLGQGGYGQVWEAIAPGGRHVAIKIIRNLDGSAGKQEFRALELIKGVDHNHLMELHAYWLLDREGAVIPDEIRDKPGAPVPSTLVIASKLASKNLLQRLKECIDAGERGIPVAELLGQMRQAAQAIDYLNDSKHPLGDRCVAIQHRDIKPENILLAAGVVKVGDFGLAKVVEGTSAVVHADSSALTVSYAAPELFENCITRWSDQYSLALTYFKLRTGGMPFPPSCRANEMILRHVQGKLDLSQLPDAERPVIQKATTLDPEQRYPSCLAMVEELERACKKGSTSSRKSSPKLPPAIPPTDSRGNPSVESTKPRPAAPKVDAPTADYIAPEKPSLKNSALLETVIFDLPPLSFQDDATTRPTPPKESPPTQAPHEPVASELEDQPTRTIYKKRPPTSPVTPVATREVQLPADKTREVHLPAVPTVVSEPDPTVAAADTGPIPAIVSPVQSTWRLRVLLALLSMTALGGGLWYFQGQRILDKFRDRTDEIRTGVQRLVQEKKYGDAYELTETWRLNRDVQEQLRQGIAKTWLQQANYSLVVAHDFAQAEKTAREILKVFRTNADAKKILDSASLAREIQSQIKPNADCRKLDRQVDENANLPPEIKQILRSEIRDEWLKQAQKSLMADNDFDRAKRMAQEILQRNADSETAKQILTQADIAQLIKDTAKPEAADKLLTDKANVLGKDLTASLRASIKKSWLEQAKREFEEDKDLERALTTANSLAKAYPEDTEANDFIQSIRSRIVQQAQKELDLAIQRLRTNSNPNDEETKQLLAQAIQSATTICNRFGPSFPDGWVILAKAYELDDRISDAFRSLTNGLHDPTKATLSQVGLLFARIEFMLNPAYRKYFSSSRFSPLAFVEYAERGKSLTEEAPVPAAVKSKAFALAARARLNLLFVTRPIAEKDYNRQWLKAVADLEQAKAYAPSDSDESWACRYDLGLQLKELIEVEKDKSRKEMSQKLAIEVLSDAPSGYYKDRIDKLLADIKKLPIN